MVSGQSASNSVRRINEWHTNCFEEVRKEKADENQDEFEGWPEAEVVDRLISAARRGPETVAQEQEENSNENQDEREGWFISVGRRTRLSSGAFVEHSVQVRRREQGNENQDEN